MCVLKSELLLNNIFLLIILLNPFLVSEENCDRVIRAGLMQYALDVFNIKLYTANKAHPKIFSSALDVLVHISNTSTFNALQVSTYFFIDGL